MFRFVVYSLTLFFAASAMAEPILVQSGDHERFSRLVFQVPKASNWQAKRDGDEVNVTVSEHGDGFDTAGVYRLIKRDRIKQISSTNSEVSLSIQCDCDVTTAEINDRFLIIDVVDRGYATGDILPQVTGKPNTSNKVTSTLADFNTEYSKHLDSGATSNPHRTIEAVPLPWLGRPISGYTGELAIEETARADASISELKVPASESIDQIRLKHFESQLAEQISRAATQGILDSTYKEPSALPVQPEESDSGHATLDFPEDEPSGIQENMRVTTSNDQLESKRSANRLGGEQTCPTGIIDVNEWSFEDRTFIQELAELRRGLFSEFDRLDQVVARKLVRLYIYAGFGAEAIDILNEVDLQTRDAVLYEAAQILEFGLVRDGDTLAMYQECDSDIALWAILADNQHPEISTANTAAALRAINNLPPHLRRTLAPMLADKRLSVSDSKGASAALRSVERLETELTSATLLARADIDRATGKVRESEAALESIIAKGTKQSPEALVRLIRIKLGQRMPIDVDLATLVEAYAKEYKGSEIGQDLAEVRIIAFAQSGQFDRAFHTLANTHLSEEKSVSVHLDVLQNLVKFASDPVFLDFIYQEDADFVRSKNANLSKSIATRLRNLGFAGKAKEFDGPITNDIDSTTLVATHADQIWDDIATAHTDAGNSLTSIQAAEMKIPSQNDGLLQFAEEAISESRQARDAIRNLLQVSKRDTLP